MKQHNLSLYISAWLFGVAFSVLIMVLIGGYTRLSHAGLSMVEWKPVMGIIPPISEAEWSDEFRKYQKTPEFQQVNMHMALSAFKHIFWIEFAHRMWGRFIGLIFFFPLVFFWWRGAFTPSLKRQMLLVSALGVAQAFMGWYMVKSGLKNDPMVSPYRLSAHLVLALFIMSLLVSAAVKAQNMRQHIATHFRMHGEFCLVLLLLTIFYGALVSGMRAGLLYNTFPLMEGAIFPDDAWALTPFYRNFFENPTMVQLLHRVLAFFSFCSVMLLGFKGYKSSNLKDMHKWFFCLWGIVSLQFFLGVMTLLSGVNLYLALTHQIVAFCLFLLTLYLVLNTRCYKSSPILRH